MEKVTKARNRRRKKSAPVELKKIQGFPEGYILEGNQSDQKKFIGNSVVPHVVKAWIEALGERIISNENQKRA